MTHQIDEFSKSLADESIPRRDTFRLLGTAVAGALLGPLGMKSAFGGGADPCKAYCNQCSGRQRNQCLAACRECSGNTNRLCGACGSFVCCPPPGQYETGACVDRQCSYRCVDGAADCGSGDCTPLWNDPNNCGACGNACPQSAPICNQGVCGQNPCSPSYLTRCNGVCVNLNTDMNNCGACGNACPQTAPVCNGNGVCFDPGCAPGLTWCQLQCVDLNWDNNNCGACNHQCDGGTSCIWGRCEGAVP